MLPVAALKALEKPIKRFIKNVKPKDYHEIIKGARDI